MKFRNILIAPDGSIHIEQGECAYFHSKFFSGKLKEVEKKEGKSFMFSQAKDIKLPDDNMIHTKTTADGTYILIVQEIKTAGE